MSNYLTHQVADLRRDEDGQIAYMMLLTLPVVFVFMALAIDGGIWFFDHRSAQNQADAAALAAVQDLPAANTTQATTTVDNWLTKNGSGPEDRSCLEYTDGNGDGLFDAVRVCVRRQSPGMFANFSGIPFVHVSAAAAANTVFPPSLYSLFANPSCPDSDPNLEIGGSVSTFGGAVHSNCNLKLNGSSNTFDGSMTYFGNEDVTGADNICIGSPCDPYQARIVPMPLNYTFADVPCDYTNVEDMTTNLAYWVDPLTMTRLKPGVYCNATGKVTLGNGGVEGMVTLVGYEVVLSGANYNLTPYWNGILVFATSDSKSAILASGSGGSWGGAMYAPNGQVNISGSSGLAIGGSVIADTIVVAGSDISVQGNIIGEAAIARLALVE